MVARNCCESGCAPDGGKNEYGGETLTPTGPALLVIVAVADPLREASARLTAEIVTGLAPALGTADGARKSTLPATGPAGATQGFEPPIQIWPELAFPFAMLLMNHETAASGVPETAAVRATRCAMGTEDDGGEMLTATWLASVMAAETLDAPNVTALAVAWIVAAFTNGKSAGAV